MNKMIIAVFDSEEQAYKGLANFKDLHNSKDITVYANAVITKNENGEVKVNQLTEHGYKGTAVGTLTGALVGLIGGPAGLAFGGFAGMLGGILYDSDNAIVSYTFLNEVSEALNQGKSAVVVDADEDWTTPLDHRLEALDAVIYRRDKFDVAEEQYDQDIEALNNEISDLKEDLKSANDDLKEGIQKKLDIAKQKKSTYEQVVDNKINNLKAEYEERISVLNDQIEHANEKNKVKLTRKKEQLESKYQDLNKKISSIII